uniref:Secreted protein n=1 Tax=Heterorhabditis bacteriophora TaxID=37862 RepID=A0A1I7WCK4_HETBA
MYIVSLISRTWPSCSNIGSLITTRFFAQQVRCFAVPGGKTVFKVRNFNHSLIARTNYAEIFLLMSILLAGQSIENMKISTTLPRKKHEVCINYKYNSSFYACKNLNVSGIKDCKYLLDLF